MESITNSHLLDLHSYLLKNLQEHPGVNVIKTELITRHQRQCPEYRDDVIKFDKMCPRCFTSWSEGNHSLKFKSIKRHLTKSKTKIMVIKCFSCSKSTLFEGNSSYRIMRRAKNLKKSNSTYTTKNSSHNFKKKKQNASKKSKKSILSNLSELL